MEETLLLEVILGIITFSASTFLGVVIFLKNQKSSTHRLFLLLAILINIYVVVNYISLHPPSVEPEVQLFWIRIVMFVTSFIGPVLLVLAHTFPRAKVTMSKKVLLAIFGLMITSAIFSLTPMVFSGIEYPNGRTCPNTRSWHSCVFRGFCWAVYNELRCAALQA